MSPAYDAPEVMAVAMARLIRDHELVFVGVNSPLPFVAATLARRLHAPHSTMLSSPRSTTAPAMLACERKFALR